MKVLKFGGTSVKDANALKQVFKIVSGNKEKQIVVLSACSGITDSLIFSLNYAAKNQKNELEQTLQKIKNHHLQIIQELFADSNNIHQVSKEITLLLDEFERILEGIYFLKESTPRALDNVMSFGELLSTKIFYHYCLLQGMEAIWLDARKFMKTDSNYNSANVDFEKSKLELKNYLDKEQFDKKGLAITQGFIGSDDNNRTTTLGRGGSDYSAAIIGKLCNASEIQIWTDVDGILTADPRITNNTKTIEIMEFEEVRLLSYFGAKVLHPNAILPAIEGGIPTKVLNTFAPDNQGTTILQTAQNMKSQPHSVVPIKCVRVSFPLSNYDNFATEATKILDIIAKYDFKVYFSTLLPEGLTLWMDKSCNYIQKFSFACENYPFELNDNIVLLGITGCNMNHYISNQIIDLLQPYGSTVIYQNPKGNLILIEANTTNYLELLNTTNNWIINFLNSMLR